MRKKIKIFNGRFYAAAALLLSAGIFLAVYANAFLIAAAGFFLFLVLGGRRKLFLIFFIIGAAYVPIALGVYESKHNETRPNASIEGVIDSLISENASGVSFYINGLKVDGERYNGRARVVMSDKTIADGALEQGLAVRFTGEISKYNLYPKVNFSMHAYNRGCYYGVKPVSDVSVSKSDFGGAAVAAAFRRSVYSGLNAYLSAENAGVAYALMFGDRTDITDDVASAYKNAGLMHVFAVSGLHFGFLFAFLAGIFRRLKLKNRTVRNILTFLIFLAFAYVCGFSPSVMRSVIMITVYSYAAASGRKNDRLNSLSFAAVLILLINPFFLFDLGFVLSFTAVLGLALFTRKIGGVMTVIENGLMTKIFPDYRKELKRADTPRAVRTAKKLNGAIKNSLVMTFSANVGVFPVMCAYFGGIPLAAFAANIIVVPAVSVLFPYLLAASVIGVLFPPLQALLAPTDFVIGAVNAFTNLFSQNAFLAGEGLAAFVSARFGEHAPFVFSLLYYASLLYLSDVYIGPRLGIIRKLKALKRNENDE
ncbi:MAG: ComEC/Rec2 family competence protein [Clostridiales bacterium]|jgi:competence protein ComEC|nr:ComEC/Rec2 family competence protein [Clostridiales bacterium]